MSIIDSFDTSKPVISPESFYKRGYIADKCIVTFSQAVAEDVKKHHFCKKVAASGSAFAEIPIYLIQTEGEAVLFYLSPIGAAIASGVMEEVKCITGANTFIVFGSCGSLNREKTEGKLIVPTESYRDEGLSYHYMKPSDYIEITNHEKLAGILDELGIPYSRGRVWTTDAIYMETENNVTKRKAEGCIAVEMESAGLQAMCSFRGIDFYTFFFASDLVDGSVWENVTLGKTGERAEQMNCFEIALKVIGKLV